MFDFQSPCKYVIVVISAAVTLKLPRFFHFKLSYDNNVTNYVTTTLMEDPTYIWLNACWDDLIATGFLPLAALMYLNLKIYQKEIIIFKVYCKKTITSKDIRIKILFEMQALITHRVNILALFWQYNDVRCQILGSNFEQNETYQTDRTEWRASSKE